MGEWTDRCGHTSWSVYDAPAIEAFLELENEPEFMLRATFSHIEKKIVTSAKETLKFFASHKALK